MHSESVELSIVRPTEVILSVSQINLQLIDLSFESDYQHSAMPAVAEGEERCTETNIVVDRRRRR